MTTMTRRQINIINRMAVGYTFYPSRSPRISVKEVLDLEKLGFRIQGENPIHEPSCFYALDRDEMKNQAIQLGIFKADIS